MTKGPAGRKLFYLVDWLPPDFGPTGQYALVFAHEIAKAGRHVRVIGLTTGPAGNEIVQFATGSLRVTRIKVLTYNKARYVSRLWWFVRANCRLVLEVLKDPKSRGADILFTGSPPFMLYFACATKWLARGRLIYRITDFYPEVILAELGRKPPVLAVVERITWALRRHVDEFEVLGEDQRRLLIRGGIATERIRLKRDVCPIRFTGQEAALKAPATLTNRLILLYSGNYGVAHDVDTVVEGLVRHYSEGNGCYGLWLNSSGVRADAVEQRLSAAGIPVARSHPVPLDQLAALLAAADVHLITLRAQFSGIVLPSKVYACLASRRPIIFVGPESSDVHLLCSQQKEVVYARIDPGDIAGFAATLDRLAAIRT